MLVKAKSIHGTLMAPPSKSHGQRLLLLSCLCENSNPIQNLGTDQDTQAMLKAIQGLKEAKKEGQNTGTIYVGESGFALRTLAFVGNVFYEEYKMEGCGTLLNRKHKSTIEILEQLGLSVAHKNFQLPFIISGQIKNQNLVIDGSEGSQYVSGLFLLAAITPGSWHLQIENLRSRAYFDMTLALLKDAGFLFKRTQDNFEFHGAQQLKSSKEIVEGDWSSVAGFLVGAAINGNLSIDGLNKSSLQPDSQLLVALKQFGGKHRWEDHTLIVNSTDQKLPFDFDCTHCPDLFPVLVVLACAANGKSSISGIERLKNKESDRLLAMSQALDRWGIHYQIRNNTLFIEGKGKVNSSNIKTHHDHRIVMAGAISSLLNPSGQTLEETGSVKKSYPDFFKDFEILAN